MLQWLLGFFAHDPECEVNPALQLSTQVDTVGVCAFVFMCVHMCVPVYVYSQNSTLLHCAVQ